MPELGKGQRKKRLPVTQSCDVSTQIQRSPPVPTSYTRACPITPPPNTHTHKQKQTDKDAGVHCSPHRGPANRTSNTPITQISSAVQQDPKDTAQIHMHTPRNLYHRQRPQTWEAAQCDPKIRRPHWDSHPGKGQSWLRTHSELSPDGTHRDPPGAQHPTPPHPRAH